MPYNCVNIQETSWYGTLSTLQALLVRNPRVTFVSLLFAWTNWGTNSAVVDDLGRLGAKVTRDPSHKSHNALDKYPAMQYFVTEMCSNVHISVTKWCIVRHGAGAFWDLWIRPIAFRAPANFYVTYPSPILPIKPIILHLMRAGGHSIKWTQILLIQ